MQTEKQRVGGFYTCKAPKTTPEKPYQDFLKSKVRLAQQHGFSIELSEINPILKAHQKAMVKWMVAGGLRACFAAFGLGKSVIQLEVVRIVLAQGGGRGLIVAPLGVRQEFLRDAQILATGDHPEITDAQRPPRQATPDNFESLWNEFHAHLEVI